MTSLVAVVVATGCGGVTPSVTAQPDAATAPGSGPTDPPRANEESTSMHPDASHRATVVTNAGRIDATVHDDELEMHVSTETGWHSTVERDDARTARVMWTSGERSVVVELWGSASGITHQVVAHG